MLSRIKFRFRIKKQQSLKKSKSPKSDGGSPAEDDKTKTKKRYNNRKI